MNFIVPLHDYHQFLHVLEVADGLFFGHQSFGTRLSNHFEIDQINHMIKKIHQQQKKSFLLCNHMMDDQQLEAFNNFIGNIDTDHLDGIIIADIGVLMALKDMGLSQKVIYHPETLHTNHYDFNYFHFLKIKGAFVSKEITLDDILTIGKHKAYELFMMGHGHLSMFYSKRHLIENYKIHHDIPIDYVASKQLKLIEEHRDDQAYPILEDLAGTHVFRSDIFYTTNQLEVLSQVVDYLFLDTIFKDDAYTISIVDIYKHHASSTTHINDLKHNYQETWSEGFLFKKTMYKKVQDD